MGSLSTLPLCLAVLLFMSGDVVKAQQGVSEWFFFENPVIFNGDYGAYTQIYLGNDFFYNGKMNSYLYLGMAGFISFYEPNNIGGPNANNTVDMIAPLWVDMNTFAAGSITYEQASNGTLFEQAAIVLNNFIPGLNVEIAWVFLAQWNHVKFEPYAMDISFGAYLITDVNGNSYVLYLYGNISPLYGGYIWLAGYSLGDMGDQYFVGVPVLNVMDLAYASNVNSSGVWFFDFGSVLYSYADSLPYLFYTTHNELRMYSYEDVRVDFPGSFEYFGIPYDTVFINGNGALHFQESLNSSSPDPNAQADIIAPLWSDFDLSNGGSIYYGQATSGPIISKTSNEINQKFYDSYISAQWVLVVTWQGVQFADGGSATFQVVLVSDGDLSYVLINYANIDSTGSFWLAGYEAKSEPNYFITEPSSNALSTSSNNGALGQWVLRVNEPEPESCDALDCTVTEVCTELSGHYGCACAEDSSDLNSATFDATETCASSTGTLSLSRCQLFEAGFSADSLHLNNPECRGQVQDGRVVFQFDNDANVCGTVLRSNASHFIYANSVKAVYGAPPRSMISRDRWFNMDFSCVYPLIRSISMPMAFSPTVGVVSRDLSTEGTYVIQMIPYLDSSFNIALSNNATVDVNQQLYVAVAVDGVDSRQISVVLDNCWATPVYDMNYYVRWDLITDECANPEDGTVQIIQNGVSTAGLFSFRMFTFTSISENVYLHCKVHLCLLQSGDCAQTCTDPIQSRRRRSVEFHDSAHISMGF